MAHSLITILDPIRIEVRKSPTAIWFDLYAEGFRVGADVEDPTGLAEQLRAAADGLEALAMSETVAAGLEIIDGIAAEQAVGS